MKIFGKLFLLSICGSMLLYAGCGKKEYSLYTNMADSDFKIIDSSYKQGGVIGGLTLPDTETEDIDSYGYTPMKSNFYAMTAPAELGIYSDFSTEDRAAQFNKLASDVMKKLYEIEKALSSTIADSDVYKFNNAQAGAELEVGYITYAVLTEAKAVYTLTDGYYNPALYYNVQAYGFGGAEDYPYGTLPDENKIAKYTDLAARFGDVQLREEEGKYFVTKPEYTVEVDGEALSLKLDLGGIGKGYAVDCVDSLIDEYDYKFGYFSFGTSSMLVKNNLGDGNFSLGLSSPRSPSREPYLSTTIRNEKLSTSGDNEQFYTVGGSGCSNGIRYCHIIDPTTGKPIQTGIMSVTVIGGGAAEDDALTTAIMCMGRDRAIQFIEEKLTDRRVVFTVE